MGIIITRRSELLVLFHLVFRFCRGGLFGFGGAYATFRTAITT